MQIDVKNSEANLINYLFSQIDAGSFLTNWEHRLSLIQISFCREMNTLQMCLAAEDTTQQPEILIKQCYSGRQGRKA